MEMKMLRKMQMRLALNIEQKRGQKKTFRIYLHVIEQNELNYYTDELENKILL